PTVSDFESYTEEQIRTRPELQQIEAQRRAALADARAARADRLPQMTYNVNGGFDAGDIHQLNRFSGGSAIVTLTVPVFDFGVSRSRETQARLRAEQLDSQRELAMRQLRQEFYTARAAALAALARVRDAQSGVTAAQFVLRELLISARASGRPSKAQCVGAGEQIAIKIIEARVSGRQSVAIKGLSLSSIALFIFFNSNESPDGLGFMLSPSSTAKT